MGFHHSNHSNHIHISVSNHSNHSNHSIICHCRCHRTASVSAAGSRSRTWHSHCKDPYCREIEQLHPQPARYMAAGSTPPRWGTGTRVVQGSEPQIYHWHPLTTIQNFHVACLIPWIGDLLLLYWALSKGHHLGINMNPNSNVMKLLL